MSLGFDMNHFDKLIIEACEKSDDDFDLTIVGIPGKAVIDIVTVFSIGHGVNPETILEISHGDNFGY